LDDEKLEKYADYIAKLTFNMQKICSKKETFFCKSINITPIEFRCLRYLLKNDFLSVKELANLMELTPPRVTTLLNSLEEKKYIERKIAKKDRRNIKVLLTKKGKSFATEVRQRYIDYHKEMLSYCEPDNVEEMIANIEKFGNILESFLKTNEGVGK